MVGGWCYLEVEVEHGVEPGHHVEVVLSAVLPQEGGADLMRVKVSTLQLQIY